MNRRHFLQKGSMAFATIAALPLAVRSSTNQNAPTTYALRNITEKDKTVSYIFKLIHKGVTDFALATPKDKLIEVQTITVLDKTSGATKTVSLFYDITKAEKTNVNNGTYKVSVKLNEKVSGDSKASGNLSKTMELELITFSLINILKKDGTPQLTFKYEGAAGTTPSSSDDDGCFLTTACVFHKGKADDCDELQTLRWLRSNYIANTTKGKELLKTYKTEGPRMLKTMKSFENRPEILDYIHDKLVQPSVAMIKKGQHQQATEYYTAFVKQMMLQYL